MADTPRPFRLSRRRFALWLGERLRRLAFWLDVRTAPKYDVTMWPALDISDEEWAAFQEALHG